ncbi:IclR family transcriptional regulator [Microbacterium sp.]|uniref:IclR family transcriptional regulator n=1 Tax=Microbacterium sp. TaxID=51671 RepID=UPI003A899E11
MSQSVDRALSLLVFLEQGPHSLGECADLLGVHKSTALRLLQTLEAQRFVTHDVTHQYQLGSRIFELSNAALAQRSVRDIVRPHLERLNIETGQTVHLAALESGEAVYIDKVEARAGIRMYSRVGLSAPVHCTAVGKVLVAALPEPERERIALALRYERMTENTIRTPAAFLAELARVRAEGFARDHQEHETFINCIAAPVRDGSGAVVAALSMSAPTVSLSAEEAFAQRHRVMRTAAEASADLGWAGASPRKEFS